MRKDEILKNLEAVLKLEGSEPTSESEVQNFRSAPAACPSGTVKKVREKLVHRVLKGRTPFRISEENLTFGQWIETTRSKEHLTRKDITAALNQDPSFIEKLETEQTLPWEVELHEIADVICLFRIHIDGAAYLSQRSLGERIKNKIAQPKSLPYPYVNSEKMAANKSDTSRLDFDIAKLFEWLDDLRNELIRRNANDLLI